MKKIALIGAGQLGSRHLQALAKTDIPVMLHVVDPNETSLQVARERYLEIPKNKNISSIDFLPGIDNLNEDYDLCIIATRADVRFQIFQELTSKINVSHIVLEKVAFQSEQQFEDAKKLMSQKDISSWVNFPRRMFPLYEQLKEYLSDSEEIECCVRGGDWGLACNALHFIDLLAFFASDAKYELDISGLDPRVWPSKRAGFIEMTGKLVGTFSKGSQIRLESIANSVELSEIVINTSDLEIIINEAHGSATIFKKENKWNKETLRFKIPFQSELTHLVAKEILETGTCRLTDFDESCALHIPYLHAIKKHIETVEHRKYGSCPIT